MQQVLRLRWSNTAYADYPPLADRRSYRDRQAADQLAAYDVESMLQLAGLITHPGIASFYLPIEDGEVIEQDVLARGIAYILAQHAADHTVLVACGAGISRSTTFAIAALKAAEDRSLRDAARIVRQVHPQGMPHHALWSSLCAYYQEPVPYLELLRIPEDQERG